MGGTKMKRQVVILALGASLLALACAPLLAAASAPASGTTLSLLPASLVIDTFYAGQTIQLNGEINEGQEVVLEVRGPRENAAFDLKGRVGPFWMNRGLVKVDNAPSLYMLLLPKDAPNESQLEGLELGMGHLKAGATVAAPGRDPNQIFAQFLDFKQAAGLYQQQSGAIAYAPAGPGRRTFSASLGFPSALAAGEYEVIATVLQDGAALNRLSKTYLVEDGPFLDLVKGLAFNHALPFGVLCVVIALFTGAVMGLVFKGGKGGH